MNIDELINYIFKVDKQLCIYEKNHSVNEIDINEPNWLKIVKDANDLFIKTNKDILTDLTSCIINSFRNLTETDRNYFWNHFSKTKYVKYNISNIFLVDRSIENILLLEIIMNLMPDPRDSLLSLNELIDEFEHNEINYKPIISRLLNYADNNDWSGMGSMKSFLEKLL